MEATLQVPTSHLGVLPYMASTVLEGVKSVSLKDMEGCHLQLVVNQDLEVPHPHPTGSLPRLTRAHKPRHPVFPTPASHLLVTTSSSMTKDVPLSSSSKVSVAGRDETSSQQITASNSSSSEMTDLSRGRMQGVEAIITEEVVVGSEADHHEVEVREGHLGEDLLADPLAGKNLSSLKMTSTLRAPMHNLIRRR